MTSKYDEILKNQRTIIKKLDKDMKEEEQEIAEEKILESEEQKEEEELEKLENLELELEDELKEKPLKKISSRDFYRSMVGSFFGILGHFAFFYGVKISHDISVARATFLYIVAFLIGVVFLYMTGYRKMEHKDVLGLVPLRLLIIYFTSIIVVIFVLFLFGFINAGTSFVDVYKTVATVSILAVMGAVTADLIGKSE